MKVPKAHLAGLLWGDRRDDLARSSLRQTLRELRASINRSNEIICSDREHIWVRADALIEDRGDETREDRDAFQDLNGVSPEFDEWLAQERTRRAKRRTAALKADAEELFSAGRFGDSLELIDQMQLIDPYDEHALRLAMEAEFELGRAAAIAERFRAAAARFAADLGVRPSQESSDLCDRLVRRLTSRQDDQPARETDQKADLP